MSKYNLLEHPEKDRLLKAQELKDGSIPVYQVEIAEHTVFTSFAEMPAKTCTAYWLDSENAKGYLVANEMDDYARYQVLPESALASKPVFVENATPFQDRVEQKQKAEKDRLQAFYTKQEIDHGAFFEKATALNSLVGPVFDIPSTYEEYRGNLSEAKFNAPAPHAYFDEIKSLVERYEQASGSDVKKMDFLNNKTGPDFFRPELARRELNKQVFEAERGFSINTKVIDDCCISMKAINPKGAVMESAIVHLNPGVEKINDEIEQVAFLETYSEDTECFRFGKRIELEESLLVPVLEDFEKGCFDLGNKPSFDEELTDKGTEIYMAGDLSGLSIYNKLIVEHKDVVNKLSLMSKASMQRTKERTLDPSTMTVK